MSTSKIKWSKIFIFKGAVPSLIITFLCLGISAYLGLLVPQKITELGRQYEDAELYYNVIQSLMFVFIAVYINRVIYQLVINRYVMSLMRHIRDLCFRRWLLNYEVKVAGKKQKDQYPLGELLSRVINDAESVRELITSGAFGILIDLFFVISCLISFVTINTTSGLFLSGAQLFAAIALIWGSKYMRVIFLSVRQSRGEMYREVANTLGGVSQGYYTRNEKYASRKCTSYFDDFLHKQLKANIWDASYYSVAESLYPVLLALVVLIFPYSGITEAAIILAIVDLIQRSIGPIKDIASRMASVQRAVSGFQRVGEFVEDLSKGMSSPDGENLLSLRDFVSLSVDIRYFSYDTARPDQVEGRSHFSLENVKFSGKRGELIGLVGLSGSGKSTVLNILAGNIIPKEAKLTLKCNHCQDIEFPGNDIEEIIQYRGQVGLVSQDSHVFSDSMAFNITMGEENSQQSFDQFWKDVTVEIPYLSDWMASPYEKIELSEISLGQKQLIAALRSCYLKKTIVLFDEISSGLDSKLEQALRKVILLAQQFSLTIIVAHRIETVLQSDNIIVMDKGRVISSGNHQDLVKSSKVYREFIKEISHSAD